MVAVRDDGVPGWLGDCAAIDVDVDGLREFAATVDAQLSANLRPHTAALLGSYAQGVTFGAGNPSADLRLARLRYQECLAAVTRQLTGYLAAAEAVVAAATSVAERYGQVDALSAARLADVERALAQAAAAGPAGLDTTDGSGPPAGSGAPPARVER